MIDRRRFLKNALWSGVGCGLTGLLPVRCGSESSRRVPVDADSRSDLPSDIWDAADLAADDAELGDLTTDGGVDDLLRPNPAHELPTPVPLLDAGELLAEELVTVDENGIAVAWVTQTECPSVLAICAEGDRERQYSIEGPPTCYHLLEVGGLEAGRRYSYRTTEQALPFDDRYGLSPRECTTLAPPSGKRLFRFATLNDIHIGCSDVGLIQGIVDDSMSWPDPDNPHYLFAARAAVDELNQRGVDFVIIKGDLTCIYSLAEFELARSVLDELDMPYYPMRGNHDRVGENPDDYYLAVFRDLLPEGRSYFSFSCGDMHFICLDSSRLDDGYPQVSDEQLAWLPDELAQCAGHPTFVLLHHPVSNEATVLFTLIGRNRQAFIEAVAPHDHVVGILSGHSHRDRITHDDSLGRIPCVETAATLHYPLGYAVYDVYSEGYIQTSYRMGCPECLQWAEMTKELYDGRGVELLFLPAEERCFSYCY